ncbi:MAG: hypothetical protein Kow00114_25120 [Kiloniellaceae bacterium]
MKGAAPIRLSTSQLAAVAGVSQRAAKLAVQRCINGGTWRGCQLSVAAASGRGGKSGQSYLVDFDSLPTDLQQRALELFPELSAAPTARPAKAGKRGKDRKPRVLIGRAWDAGIDLAQDAKAEVAAELERKVQSLWASPAQRHGWRRVALYAALDLFDLCREAGSELPDAELRALCEVPRRYVSAWIRRRHRKTDIYLNDAKRFHDTMPAVQRLRAAQPMDCCFYDGTAVDLLFRARDGRQVKLWAILALDDATGMLMGHFLPRPRGEGVRMEHVALSFAATVAEFGMPRVLYCDNGSEYGWVELLKSQHLATVIKALPYNARAKSIEPAIRVFMEHHISLIDGYLGSDRMAKKTQSVGRPAAPFPGTGEDLLQALYGALEMYNSTPKPSRDNLSPYQLLQAAIDGGWRPAKADLATMIEALSRPEVRTVKRGAISIGGIAYGSDALSRASDMEGERVTVMVPVVPGFPLTLLDPNGRFFSLIRPLPAYEKTDIAGAKEAGRLKTLRRRGARDLARQALPADLGSYQERFLQLNPPPATPEPGEVLGLDGERGRAATARRTLENGGLDAPALPAPEETREPSYYELLLQKKRSAS